MNHFALTVLIIAVAALHSCESSAYIEECGPNETFNTCGTACPKTCEEPTIGPCTYNCVIGCECNKGLYRHNGACISPRACPMNNEIN